MDTDNNVKTSVASISTGSSKLDTLGDSGGKLTFGPAWLRQLSSGDSNKTQLPPSPGYPFQLSKHRYSREDMLTIFETIENSLIIPKNLDDFEDLIRKELQKPILLTSPSLDEQKCLSTCVNSQAVLNSYNKIQGSTVVIPHSRGGSNGSRGARGGSHNTVNSSNINNNNNSSNKERGSGVSNRGGRGGGGGGGGGRINNRGGGGGGGSNNDGQSSLSKLDEEMNLDNNNNTNSSSISSIRGGKTTYQKTNYQSRSHNNNNTSTISNSSNSNNNSGGGGGSGGNSSNSNNNDEREPVKKEYHHQRSSNSMNEDSWRKISNDEKEISNDNNNNKNSESSSSNSNEKTNRNNEWRTTGTERNLKSSEWSSKSKYNNNNNNSQSRNLNENRRNEQEPEWLNDDDDDEDIGNAFDESGKFIKKENKRIRKTPSPNSKDAATVQPKKPPSPIVTTPTPTATQQKQQEKIIEIDKNIKKLLPPPPSTPPSTPPTTTTQNIETNSINNQIIKDTTTTNNHEINNNDNKKENFINREGGGGGISNIDQVLLNSLLNTTSKLTPITQQQINPEPQINPKDPSLMVGYNQLNSLSQLLNTNQSPPIQTPQTNLQAQLLAQAILQQQQQQQQHFNSLKLNNENNDAKKGAVNLNHPDADKWLYLDPQNQIQGTFTSEEMAAWFAAGYFTLNLMIKRGCDDQFLPLGQVAKNWGRIPFSPGSQPAPLLKNKEQLALQMFQQMQQLQLQQQQQNNYRNDDPIINVKEQQISPIQNMLQQEQYRQQQQQPQLNLHDPLIQQEYLNRLLLNNKQQQQQQALQALILQQQQHQKQLAEQQLTIDPAIVSAAAASSTKSIWGDIPANKINPFVNNTNTTSTAIRDESNNIPNLHLLNLGASAQQLQNDKINAFFEQTKKDDEKRRKQEEYMRIKFLRDEEESLRNHEELKLREEEERLRKEEQKKRVQEIIKRDEEDRMKRLDEEIKRKKDEESRQILEALKKRDELKRLEMEKARQEEEKKRFIEKQQQQELIKKQLEKQKQQELTNLQLPAHANWAKNQLGGNSSGNNVVPLKSIFEQQQTIEALEKRQLMELQQKQVELQAQQNQSGTWSSLFRGAKQNPPSLLDIQNEQAQIEMAKHQEQMISSQNKQKATTMSSLLSKPQAPQPATWAAWGNNVSNNSNNNNNNDMINSNFPLPTAPQQVNHQTAPSSNNNATPFWNTPAAHEAAKKPQNKTVKNPTQVPAVQPVKTNKNVDIQEVAQKVFKNSQISDEFMKWCHDQLKDFKGADLHIPTFVNFLSEIQTCDEIEEYVCNYFGDSQQAKEFAQSFYFNRENQKSRQELQQHESQFKINQTEAQALKKKQKKIKGQPVNLDLLGFTVQSDPNSANRGEIEEI